MIAMKLLVLGVLVGLLVLFPLSAYLYVRLGFLSLATTARPLPLEEFLAKTALHQSIGGAADRKNPLATTDENLLAGAKEYRDYCAVCHGLPGQPKAPIAAGMFPVPPQLLEGPSMVTDDPEGATFWKLSNGIRLSGMPRFDTMPESARWQLAMLLRNADKLPPATQQILRQPLAMPR
jgi:thiosulfate dehydrogenase